MGPGDYLGGTKKNRGTVITSLQLAFRRRDRNFTLLPFINRTIAPWRYLTTTTRIHFGFALLFKFVNPAEDLLGVELSGYCVPGEKKAKNGSSGALHATWCIPLHASTNNQRPRGHTGNWNSKYIYSIEPSLKLHVKLEERTFGTPWHVEQKRIHHLIIISVTKV